LPLLSKELGRDVVVESNALPPPTGPLQQHGCERARLCPAQAVGIGGEAQDNAPSPFPPPSPFPTILIGGGLQYPAITMWIERAVTNTTESAR
jgi:hypothetical protein